MIIVIGAINRSIGEDKEMTYSAALDLKSVSDMIPRDSFTETFGKAVLAKPSKYDSPHATGFEFEDEWLCNRINVNMRKCSEP